MNKDGGPDRRFNDNYQVPHYQAWEFDITFTDGRIDTAFAKARIKPNVTLEAIDADVIKTYVRLGMGVGLVAEMAVRDDPPGGDLARRPVGHLFGPNTLRVAFKRGAYLRHFVFAFAELLSERLTRALIEQAMAERPGSHPTSYEL